MPSEKCPKCGREKKPFERAGAVCHQCKHQARMGERDDDEPAPRTVVPARPFSTEVATVLLTVPAEAPPKCWRCGRISGVLRTGHFAGMCKNCQNAGRMAAKRTGAAPSTEFILTWCRAVKYGAGRVNVPPKVVAAAAAPLAEIVTPAPEGPGAAAPLGEIVTPAPEGPGAPALRYVAGAAVFVRLRQTSAVREHLVRAACYCQQDHGDAA